MTSVHFEASGLSPEMAAAVLAMIQGGAAASASPVRVALPRVDEDVLRLEVAVDDEPAALAPRVA